MKDNKNTNIVSSELGEKELDNVAGGKYDDLHWWERTRESWIDAGRPNSYAYFLGLDWE